MQGVVFTLIIIRVGLGYTMDEISGNKGSASTAAGPVTTIGGTEYGMRPLAINVSVSQTHDGRTSLDNDTIDQKDHGITDVESGTSRVE